MRPTVNSDDSPSIGLRIPIRGYEYNNSILSYGGTPVTNPYKGL